MTSTTNSGGVIFEVTGARGPLGPASGPLGSGSVTAATISNDSGEQDAILTKIRAYRRERLTANRTYYVRTTGSDSNTGLSNTNGAAFATIQHAIDVIYQTLDLSGYVITIQVADGTYQEQIAINGLPVGAGRGQSKFLYIIGNEATPSNVVISLPSGGTCLTLDNSAYCFLAGVKCQNATGGFGWVVRGHSILDHRNCDFGNIFADMISTQHGGIVRAQGPLKVTGNAATFCHFIENSLVDFANQTITLNNNVFSQYLWGGNNATCNLDGATIAGYATAAQISVHNNAYMNVNLAAGVWTASCEIEMNGGGYISSTTAMYNRTFYVRPDGNDKNDGLADNAGRGFKTINGAIIAIAKLPYDPIMFSDAGIAIRVAAGTYNENVILRTMPYAKVALLGNNASPGTVIINGVSDAIQAPSVRTPWEIGGVTINPASGNSGIRASGGSVITYHDVIFGAAGSGYHIMAEPGAQVTATGNYTVAGSASAHIFGRAAAVDISGKTVTLTGTPAFSTAFAYLDDRSILRAVGNAFSGSATGKRYDITVNSAVNTNGGGASYLPGNASGTSGTGAQYV